MTRILRKRGVVTSNFPRKAEFIQHVRTCLAKAREIYGDNFTLSDAELPIVFLKNGRAAGRARWMWSGSNATNFNVEFSIEAINLDWDDMVNDTIPHEIAHIVDAFIHGRNYNKHNHIWQTICRRLGGSGKTTHSLQVTKSRKSTQVLYTASCGTQVWLGVRQHNKIQREGAVRRLKKTGGRLASENCNWLEQKV